MSGAGRPATATREQIVRRLHPLGCLLPSRAIRGASSAQRPHRVKRASDRLPLAETACRRDVPWKKSSISCANSTSRCRCRWSCRKRKPWWKSRSRSSFTCPFELREYLLKVSDVVYGRLEPVTASDPHSHTYLPEVASVAWDCGLPRDLVPLCQDGRDYYAVDVEGTVAVGWRRRRTHRRELGLGLALVPRRLAES